MTIYLAADHAGFQLKAFLKKELEKEFANVVDCGAHTLDPIDDYPDFISKAAELVVRNPSDKAIIFGKSGQGEAMVANRYKGVRAAVWYGGSMDIPRLARQHNDANMLSVGAGFVSQDEALEAARLFLKTEFMHEQRHARRIGKF